MKNIPFWIKASLAVLACVSLFLAGPYLYEKWRHPESSNIFDKMYYSSIDSNGSNIEAYLPGSDANLIKNMAGLKRGGEKLDSLITYTYSCKSEAKSNQLYCNDNETLYILQNNNILWFCYDVYLENDLECMRISGKIVYYPSQKQVSALSQRVYLSQDFIESNSTSPVIKNNWQTFEEIPESKISETYSRFNLSQGDALSYNKYFLNKVVEDFIASNNGNLPFTNDDWGEFTFLDSEPFISDSNH